MWYLKIQLPLKVNTFFLIIGITAIIQFTQTDMVLGLIIESKPFGCLWVIIFGRLRGVAVKTVPACAQKITSFRGRRNLIKPSIRTSQYYPQPLIWWTVTPFPLIIDLRRAPSRKLQMFTLSPEILFRYLGRQIQFVRTWVKSCLYRPKGSTCYNPTCGVTGSNWGVLYGMCIKPMGLL